MNIYCPALWKRNPLVDYSADQIRLDEILPKAGDRVSAYFSRDEGPSNREESAFIWMPPLTEINGWDIQPSEIAKSFVVIGFPRRIQGSLQNPALTPDLENLVENSQEFQLLITNVLPLLDVCTGDNALNSAWTIPSIMESTFMINRTVCLWDKVRWARKAHFEGFIFISGNASESRLQMILKKEGKELVAYFHSYCSPGGADYSIGRKVLSGQESKAIQRVIDKAVLIEESTDRYLIG